MEFYLAEAVERGFVVPGTAIGHYNNGVTASITYWGGTAAEAVAYLAQPSVMYTPGATYKQKLGVQQWLAFYNRGWDAWTSWRRLDSPQLELAADALTDVIPVRFPYPVTNRM